MLAGESALAVCSSDQAWKTIKAAERMHKNIKFSIPVDQTVLWFDCLAIPKSAKNKHNAHKFINFILNPRIAAKISNFSGILVNIPGAVPYISTDLQANEAVFPKDPKQINNFLVGHAIMSAADQEVDKKAIRTWAYIKIFKE